LARHLADVIADPAPLLCEVMIDPEQALLPKLASYKRADGTMASRPLEDMLPLLDRVVLQADLTIPLLD
jgi:acetolactate synthase-1/2/3 large subunit